MIRSIKFTGQQRHRHEHKYCSFPLLSSLQNLKRQSLDQRGCPKDYTPPLISSQKCDSDSPEPHRNYMHTHIFFNCYVFIFMCMGVLTVHMPVLRLCAWCPWRSEEGIRFPENRVTDCCELPCGRSELKSDPLFFMQEPLLVLDTCFLKLQGRGWGDGSVVKSTDCSSGGPEFSSQPP